MDDNTRLVRIIVRANVRKEYVKERRNGGLEVAVKAPPTDGRANARVCELLAHHFAVPLREIRIARGQSRSHKTVRVGL